MLHLGVRPRAAHGFRQGNGQDERRHELEGVRDGRGCGNIGIAFASNCELARLGEGQTADAAVKPRSPPWRSRSRAASTSRPRSRPVPLPPVRSELLPGMSSSRVPRLLGFAHAFERCAAIGGNLQETLMELTVNRELCTFAESGGSEMKRRSASRRKPASWAACLVRNRSAFVYTYTSGK